MKSAIEQEIAWCESHMGESANGIEFEKGFIAGLRQALRFEKAVEKLEAKGLQAKVIKELGFGMGMPNEIDIAFVAIWISKRQDDHLSPTFCAMYEEPIPDEVKKKIAELLREYAERITEDEPPQVNPGWVSYPHPRVG